MGSASISSGPDVLALKCFVDDGRVTQCFFAHVMLFKVSATDSMAELSSDGPHMEMGHQAEHTNSGLWPTWEGRSNSVLAARMVLVNLSSKRLLFGRNQKLSQIVHPTPSFVAAQGSSSQLLPPSGPARARHNNSSSPPDQPSLKG